MIRATQARKLLFQLLAILTVAVFYPQAQAQAQVSNMTVELKVNADETALEATTRGKCGDKNHNGCLDIPVHKKARLQFLLKNRACSKPGGTQWDLTGFYLGGKNSASKTGSWGNLDAQVQEDFSVGNPSSGLLNLGADSNAGNIVIFNNNKHAYDIWYKVVATCMDADGFPIVSIELDPRIRNGGTE